MIHVQLAHLIVTLLRVERRRSKIDDTIPEEGLVLELLFYGVPVIEQEVEQSFIAGRTAGIQSCKFCEYTDLSILFASFGHPARVFSK
ncbi:hypothetical protein ALC60_01297 [Trachymyrmex zeteki]|uniref:Uncharacterized protein n=1 Tax=Mycetomoellerius zeteki TaxID=64791 RepID=A0A151XH47_9HYME|nr:hypothetical protein ALC60_01297 [Trachymyrmex zeteki]